MQLIASNNVRITIDDEDADLFAGLNVRAYRGNSYRAYSRLTKRQESLPRIIMGLELGDVRQVRPRDGDNTNLRRENLMVVSPEKSASLRNRERSQAVREKMRQRLEANPMYSQPKTKSQYRGVTMMHPNGDTSKELWRMRTTIMGKSYSSSHATEEEAARAYDAIREKHGLPAVNFP